MIDEIFRNIVQYENCIDNLVHALRECEINSYEEFEKVYLGRKEDLDLDPIPSKIRKALKEKFVTSEDDDWNNTIQSNTVEAYKKYLRSYEDGKYRNEARVRIGKLEEEIEKNSISEEWNEVDKSDYQQVNEFVKKYPDFTTAINLRKELRKTKNTKKGSVALLNEIDRIKNDVSNLNPMQSIYNCIVSYLDNREISNKELLDLLKTDPNLISASVASKLYDDKEVDLSEILDQDFLEMILKNESIRDFDPPKRTLDKVAMIPSTEVYFWGIPSSGKTCALGAILSTAQNGDIALSLTPEPDCLGFDYMTRLSNVFQDGVISALPGGTPVSSTYEMGFKLEDKKHKDHPITCIDLAGELLRCMHKRLANISMTTEEKNALDILTKVLGDNRTQNRKMHFFVIEYGAENRKYEGLIQRNYLDSAVAYIEKMKIFRKDTDGVYLLITKVDKTGCSGEELRNILTDYINKEYKAFKNKLVKICRENEINGGELKIQPFSLGEIWFQNYCRFDNRYASEILKIIIERSYSEGTTIIDKLKRIFKK